MSSSLKSPTEWERRWAPAYKVTFVLSRKFREEATDFVYKIHSNPSFYCSSEPPGPGCSNYCPNCATGHSYECHFFHPKVALLFLDVIRDLNQNLREPELTDNDVLLRILKQLPDLFCSLGHHCDFGEYGGVWMCIYDKLYQTFPYDCLLMLNIQHYIDQHHALYNWESEEDDADTDIDELEARLMMDPNGPNNSLY